MEMPKEVKTALDHVRQFHPEVTQVMYLRSGRWMYMDDDGETPTFTGEDLDMSILETAFDMVDVELPVVYALPIDEEDEDICPECGSATSMKMVDDNVGNGLHEEKQCINCGWAE